MAAPQVAFFFKRKLLTISNMVNGWKRRQQITNQHIPEETKVWDPWKHRAEQGHQVQEQEDLVTLVPGWSEQQVQETCG